MREGYVIGWANNNDVMYCACVLGVCPFSSVKYFGDSCVVNGCSSGVYIGVVGRIWHRKTLRIPGT
jgi:hypothetical protein